MATTPVPTKRGRKPAGCHRPAGWRSGSVADPRPEIARMDCRVSQQRRADRAGAAGGSAQLHHSPPADHHAAAGFRPPGRRAGPLGRRGACLRGGQQLLQSRNLLAIVHPILRQLMEDSGETVNLAVLDQSDHQAIIIDQVQCTQLMRMSAPIGGKLPMHASGAGKAFLSQLSEEQVTSLLHRKGLHAYTHATLVSPLHLKEDLAQTRKRGYSFDDEEHALGLRCVAACIYDEHREPFAAISISGPISRMTDDRVTELGALVIKAAKEVTLAYGGVK